MTWERFYERYAEWTDSTIKSCISTLSDIGSGEDVVDVVLNLSEQSLKEQLIRKAMSLNVVFTQEDFANLDGELSDALYDRVAKHGDFYFDNPHFDPGDFQWDEFYCEYLDMPKSLLEKSIKNISDFGTSDEVTEVLLDLEDAKLAETLYKRARKKGIRFTNDELEQIEAFMPFSLFEEKATIIDCTSGEDIFSELGRAAQDAADAINNLADDIKRQPKPKKQKLGFWGALALLFGLSSSSSPTSSSSGSSWSSSKKKHSGRCDCDCANCPPHYGYRYGRWYYGHSHSEGCVFGGNKCNGGRD